ncbi:MAG: prenyltransferase/squalene oxidase repeat-containing protein [Planctomycetota bacterium]
MSRWQRWLWVLLFVPRLAAAQESEPHGQDCPKGCGPCTHALEKGFQYLLSQQNPNGSWGGAGGVVSYSAVCGLALLAEGSSTKEGRFQEPLTRFVNYLRGNVQADGAINPEDTCETWSVAFTALALSEASRRDPDLGLGQTLAALASYLEKLQTSSGGWFHGQRPLAHYSSDMVAVTNLVVIALHALERAGIAVPAASLERAWDYYRTIQNEDGGFPYGIGHPMKAVALSEAGRTAVAVFALSTMGWGEDEIARKGKEFLNPHLEGIPTDRVHGLFPEYFWLGALSCRSLGNEWWDRYRDTFVRPLTRCQREDGSFEMRKLFDRRLGGFGCTLYETGMALLTLQASLDRLSFASPAGEPASQRVQEASARATAYLLACRDQERRIWTASFGEETDVVLTAVVGLAFLVGGSTHREGERSEEVAAALEYLQRKVDDYRSHWTFQYPFAMAFLSEVYRRDPNERLKEDLEKLVAASRRYQCPDGGWKYGDPEKLPIFSSNAASTYCVLFGLALARNAGIEVPGEMVRSAVTYLKQHATGEGGFRYGAPPQFVTTAGALAALSLTGEGGEEFRKGARWFERQAGEFTSRWRTDSPSGHHAAEFCLFFGTIAANRLGGTVAASWNQELARSLVKIQDREGFFELEEDPRRRGTPFSRLFCTAAALFALEAPRDALELLRPHRNSDRCFDLARLDRERWGIPEARCKDLASRLELGREFFEGRSHESFLEKLAESPVNDDARIELGWIVPSEGRYLGVFLSRTPRELKAMTEEEFESYRREWSAAKEAEWRRFRPAPGEIRGYGTAEERAVLLQTTRDLLEARGREEFLQRVRDRVQKGYLSLVFVPKGGQGATWYGFSFDEVEALTEEQFQTWRTRFLRWIEIHTPGQSRVTLFATMSDEDFEEEYAASKDRDGPFDVKRAMQQFRVRTQLELRYPRFKERETAAVVEAVAPGSPASREGLETGDRILRVEGVDVPEWDDFIFQVCAWRPGSVLELAVASPQEEAVRYLPLSFDAQ